MTVGFRSAASASTSADATSLVLNKPAGVVVGDFLLASIAVTNDNDGVNTPDGWNAFRIDVNHTATTTNLYSYWKFADGTEGASFTWTWNTLSSAAGGIMALTGVDAANPINIHAASLNGSGNSISAPSVTTTIPDCLLVCVWAMKGTIVGSSPPDSMTQRWNLTSAGSKPNLQMLCTEVLTATGATGTRTATFTSGVMQGYSQTFAITPTQNAQVSKSLNTKWRVRANAAISKNVPWKTFKTSGVKSLVTRWDIISVTHPRKSITSNWNTRSIVRSSETNFPSFLMGFISPPPNLGGLKVEALWNIRIPSGTKVLGTVWRVRNLRPSNRNVLWNTRVRTNSVIRSFWYVGGTRATSNLQVIWITHEPPSPTQVYTPTFTTLQDIISRSHRKTARIVVFDRLNGRPVYSSDDLLIPGGLMTGGVNFGNTAVRRRASLSFVDRTGVLTPGDSSLDIFNVYGHVFKVWRGVMVNGVNYEYPLGAFGITDVSIDDSGPGVLISIEGYDYGDLLSRRGLVQDYSIPAGTNFGSAIQSLLSQQMPGIEFNFVTTAFTTPALFFQTSENPWEAAIMMAKAIGCDLFFDPNGVCVMRNVPDYSVAPVGFVYDETAIDNNTALYVNKRYTNRDVHNYFIVTGEHSGNATTGGGGPIRGDAYDDNPNSRTYWKGAYGTVPAPPVSSKLVTSQAQADQAARGLLQNSIGRAERLHFNALVNPLHDVGDVIQFKRGKSKIDNRYVIDSGYIPLGHDQPMDLTTRVRQSVS